ncbi:g-protein coupled receptor [Holotrichia oblita]|uniref:G-protein coupled receptor n=1 Tax=Holotrichia oblita TaxID=644536 RepID=A0ACB9T8I0_HOLOL|nr:g-protein coupled receptor [Holotrichia oblita]
MEADVKDNEDDVYKTQFNTAVQRIGKVFSYTFWRTQVCGDIFWSVQGYDEQGSTWIMTQYFGPSEQAYRYQQIVILTHPVETKIKMVYYSTCQDGRNHIQISKTIMQHFKNDDNSFSFDFKLMRLKRKPKKVMYNI